MNYYIALLIVTCHGYFNCFMMILRSTTGPYGRSMIEVAYGEILFSLHRGCMGDDSSRRVVRGIDMLSPMLDIPGSTPVWAQCILFSRFSYYKNLYVLCFQIYTCIWCNTKTLVVSNLVLARRGSENGFRPPICFKDKV